MRKWTIALLATLLLAPPAYGKGKLHVVELEARHVYGLITRLMDVPGWEDAIKTLLFQINGAADTDLVFLTNEWLEAASQALQQAER